MSGRAPAPQIDVDDAVNCIKQSVRKAGNEEEVRVRVSSCIEDKILKPLGVTQYGHYEYTLVSGARVDALYGHVIVEYKAPGRLSSASDVARAKEQVVKYITKEAPTKAEWDRYLGVIISDRIAFVRYYRPQDTWILRGPYDITRESVIKLIEAIRGLRRKALKVETLLEEFGPESDIAKKAISTLYKKLQKPTSTRTRMLFDDWMRLFKQATGYDPGRLKELPRIASEYGITGGVDYDALIFAIQTYYALIMKLLAAEVAYLYGGGRLYKSYIAELEDKYAGRGAEGLKEALAELENGGIFKRFGYENFLEGDYFSWYLGELDAELADVLAEIARRLADYEPATPQLEPEYARDLLKRLYQHLVPRDIRHNLGEYYTPDWLADLLLDEIGLSLENLERLGVKDTLKPLQVRVLDPACGSGTFLVRYISRLRAYAREHYLDDVLADYLLNNVVGYDLNPLAVLTARTNYLLMIADLPKRGAIEIPIYLADSLMVEKRTNLEGSTYVLKYVLKTVVGEFQVPVRIVEEGLLPKVLSEVTSALRSGYSPEDFKSRLKYVFKELSNGELSVLASFYSKLLELENEGKDDVWVSIIRNAFAPMLKGKFDYVVGNPPWVRWENLPESYREVSKSLWEGYGLWGKGAGFKRDLAMLFLARCFDLYLKPKGRHAFLMPFTVFKTQAGTGFRRFLATKTKIHVIHDLVTTYPFEGAVNRTSAIVIEKVCELGEINDPEKCPDISKAVEENRKVKHIIWISEKAVPTDTPLEEVLKTTTRYQATMTPIVERDPSSSWMQVTERVLPYVRKLVSASPYKAYEGVLTALNQVYYIEIKERLPDGKLRITNPPESGQKKKVKQVEAIIEPDSVYPLIRGRDVKRWYVEFQNRYVLIPHDAKSGKPLPKTELQVKYPGIYSYLNQFREELKNRSIKPFLSLRKKVKETKGETERSLAMNKLDEMFYIVDNIGPYTFAPYKVVWKYVAGAITGKAAAFECAVLEPIGGKPAVPHEKLMLIPFENAEEAYYVAGVLNSTLPRMMVASYVIETQISTHVLNYVYVPRYDPKNPAHQEIAKLSKRAHELAKCIHAEVKPDYCRDIRNPEEELREVEDVLDRYVAKLYEMSEEALLDIKRLFAVLKAEELPEEGEEELKEVEPSVEFLKTDVVAGQRDFLELDITTAGECEKVELTLEGPWGTRRVNLGEGRHRVEVSLPEGVYGVRYRLVCGEHFSEGSVEVTSSRSAPTGPKRPSTLKLE